MSQQSCAGCHARASIDQFHRRRGRFLCPSCLGIAAKAESRKVQVALAAVFVLGVPASIATRGLAETLETVQRFGTDTIVWVLVAFFLALFHEAGHMIVGTLVGETVIGVTVGQGPVLAKFKTGHFRFQIRATLLGGSTFTIPTGRRAGRIAMLLAGVAVEAVLVILAYKSEPAGGVASSIRSAILLLGLVDIVANLWPTKVHDGERGVVTTDGGQLLAIFRGEEIKTGTMSFDELERHASFVEVMEDKQYDEALRLAEIEVAKFPEETDAHYRHGLALLMLHRYAEAATALHPLVTADYNEGEHARAFVCNNFAYAAAMTFDPQWIALADAPSAEAMTLKPLEPAIASTRGNVLVLIGEIEEGMRLLRQSLTAVGSDAHRRAPIVGMLAIAAAMSGDMAASRAHYEDMIANDPSAEGRHNIECYLARYEVMAIAHLIAEADAEGHGDVAAVLPWSFDDGFATMARLALLEVDGHLTGTPTPGNYEVAVDGRTVTIDQIRQAAHQFGMADAAS